MTRSRAHRVRCSATDGSDTEDGWDDAWRKFQLENEARVKKETNDIQNAMADLRSAEANIRATQQDWGDAAQEKEKLEIELDRVRRQQQGLPWEFEELDELYKLIQSDENFVLRLGARAAVALVLVSLALRWRADGLESVAGCLLMPLVCATGQM